MDDPPDNYLTPIPVLSGFMPDSVRAMENWFRENFEDPGRSLPYDDKAGGYQWIHGGPYRALEVLARAFTDAPPEAVERAAKSLEADGTHEWTIREPGQDAQADPLAEALGRSTPLIPVLEARWPDSDYPYVNSQVKMSLLGARWRAVTRRNQRADGLPLIDAADLIAAVLTLHQVDEETSTETFAGAEALGGTHAKLFGSEALARWRAELTSEEQHAILRWDAVTLLWTASRLRAETSQSDRAITTQHILAASFLSAEGQAALDALGLDQIFDAFRAAFVEGIRASDVGRDGDGPEAWESIVRRVMQQDRLFHRAEREKPAFSADAVRADGRDDGTDPLGTSADAKALADLILLKSASPPLAIGVFGSWGSGKSTLMRRMRETIALQNERDRAQPQPPDEDVETQRVTNVVQLEFNAWSFIDSSNLWASLTGEIFDQLAAGGGQKWAQIKGKLLLAQVAGKFARHVASKASSEEEAAREDEVIGQATQKLQRARADRKAAAVAALGDVVATGGGEPEEEAENKSAKARKPMVDALERTLLQRAATGEPRLIADIGAAGRLIKAVLAASLMFRTAGPKKWWVLAAAVVLLAMTVVLLYVGREWAAAVSSLPMLAGTLWLVRLVWDGLGVLTLLGEKFRERASAAVALESEALQEITAALAKKRAAEQRAAEEEAEIGYLSIEEMASGKSSTKLLEFLLHDLAEINAIRSQAGVLAAVRRCFEHLDTIIKNQPADAADRIDRIILYIDDLDRCDADQVVKVLEAVHLLLAFECFVVVVAIDARWIRQSLELQHPQFKRTPGEGNVEGGRPTTSDYLEKIFQIPFWVRPFRPPPAIGNLDAPNAYRSYLVQLLGPEPMEQQTGALTGLNSDRKAGEGDGARLRFEAVDPIRPTEIAEPRPKKLSLTGPERRLLGRLGPLAGKSPRAAKSFINIYRLIRGSLDTGSLGAFLADGSPTTPSFPSLMFALAIDIGLSAAEAERVRQRFRRASDQELEQLVSGAPAFTIGARPPAGPSSDPAASTLAETLVQMGLTEVLGSAVAAVKASRGKNSRPGRLSAGLRPGPALFVQGAGIRPGVYFRPRRDELVTLRLPTTHGVLHAADRIAGDVTLTPLLPLDWSGRRIWVKAECLQQGGSFKLRGASNRLARLDEAQRGRGVVAFSSGNHAQGVARAARRLGIAATIVMPADAPAVKIAATRDAGADIVFYDRDRESREEIAGRLAAERGATLVPSFDDVDIIEGQGSIGVEIERQLGAAPPLLIAPCGGGGLAAGIALALPGTRIIIAEPEGWDDMARSLACREIVPVAEPAPPTLCDALQTRRVSPLTFGALGEAGATGVAVSEDEVRAAVAFAFAHLRLVAEPGGAAALAALLADKAGEVPDGSVVVISGGNVDPELYAELIR